MPQLSFEFLLFTGVMVACFWRLPERARPPVLAVASSLFLMYWDVVSFGVLAVMTLAVHAGSGPRTGQDPNRRRLAWRIGLVALLLAFATVKGMDAFGERVGWAAFVVPLGFGFYTLKLIHYWVEVDLGDVERPSPLCFYNYMLFFPTLLVGPIHRIEPFVRGERRRRWDPELFADGLRRMLYGYAKVVVIANYAVAHLLRGYLFGAAEPDTSWWVLCECLSYGLYLYFAFAGFSDIAIGVSKLFGQDVGENFRYPFLQPNIAAFWRCWHISLSDWCRRYVFTPALARWRNPSLAVVATMVAIGLWHEFTPRYVLWGFYHGAGLALHRVWASHVGERFALPSSGLQGGVVRVVSTALTFAFVIVGFAITKNDSLVQTAADFETLLFGGSGRDGT